MKSGGGALPDEVVMEILSWLPVKPLIRFNCVCKSWKSLISDPIFVKLHLHTSPNNANLIIILNRSLKNILPTPQRVMFCSKASFLHNPSIATRQGSLFDNHIIDDHIIGSCNGLVCCLSGSSSLPDFRVRFWNPERRLKSGYSPSLPLENQLLVYTFFGFGHDQSSDTYKVVAVIVSRSRNQKGMMQRSMRNKVKVHTMGEHVWRDIQTFPALPVLYPGFQNLASFLSGTLNWLATTNLFYDFYRRRKDLLIVSLDLGNETYKQFSLPTGYGDEIGNGRPYITILGNCLCLFIDVKKTHLVVWQMKEFGVEKSWTQFLKVSYQHLRVREQVRFSSLVPLCTAENDNVLVFAISMSGIVLYNRRYNTVELGNYHRNELEIDAMDHVQSLILPY